MSTESKPRVVVIAALAAGLVLLALLLWQQHAELVLSQQDNARLTEQLRLNQPGAATGAARTAAASVKGNPAPTAGSTAAAAAPATVVSSSTPLILGAVGVKPLANPAYPEGLITILPFTRNKTDSLGVAHVFVRLPKNSSGKIVDIAASDAAGYTSVRKYVKADGKFAAFEGTPTATGQLQLELSVSTSANADLRGACDIGPIGPYQIEITPAGATVHAE